ncbi:uncharacterized protein GIQ15_06912 [Arthroderma uncinatum]|uniref:uncharacterized protein n=1 Tax=Arthroderma uncinatum TaxID=74035 RepID=UPI00144AC0D9|nr:uncharacterized protein GIQ15_06912 [Arthroderma uncinatum]KAF3479936.1 hypothetical protein GIQ15_06912 [Arthroderma uncinatum]
MISFGWSAGDIYQLVVVCHTLVSNCTLGPTSALQVIQGLREEIQELERLLQQLQNLVQDGGETSCIDLRGIEDTLRECRSHLQKYNTLQQAYDNHYRSHDADAVPVEKKVAASQSSGGRAREYLISRPKNAAKVGTELVRHVTWGGTQVSALQERVARHKQSLTLYLTVLERERSIRMGNRLQSVERMIHELHAETMPLTRSYPLQRVGSIPGAAFNSSSSSLPDGPAADNDRYHIMLEAVDRQRQYAMLQRSMADSGDDQEWETICDQLDLFHERVLYVIERKTNSSAQHGNGREFRSENGSDIALNRALLNNSRGGLKSPSNEHPSYRRRRHAAHETPLALIRDETETETEQHTTNTSIQINGEDEMDEDGGGGVLLHPAPSITTLASYASSVFSHTTSASAAVTDDTAVTAIHMEPSASSKPMYPTSASQPLSSSPSTAPSLSIPLSTSPGSCHSYTIPNSPSPSPIGHHPQHRYSTSSYASTAPSVASMENGNPASRSRGYSVSSLPSPGNLQRRSTDDSGSHSSCTWKTISLNGGVRIAWQGHPTPVRCVLAAGYRSDGRVCALRATDPKNTNERLPTLRLSSAEKRPIPHIEPPGHRDTGLEAGVIYFIKPPKTKYGENPQYFVEDPYDNEGYGTGSAMRVVYFAPARERPRYIEVHRNDIDLNPKRSHRNTMLELQLSHQLQHLRIAFSSASDLQLFTETLFRHEPPAVLTVPRASSQYADGPAPAPWASP